jgi:hypothetical protein
MRDFAGRTGIARSEEFKTVTRARIIAGCLAVDLVLGRDTGAAEKAVAAIDPARFRGS